jgi:general L-amino acid transport system substrate-binding protein
MALTVKPLLALVAGLGAVLAAGLASAQTLKAVKERGLVICGASTGQPGFSASDGQGNWTGLDIDYCRAIAAAVLGDAMKIKVVPLYAADRFGPLRTGMVDVLIRNTTWTFSRDTAQGLDFEAVNYYDGQGFMVHRSANINSVLELNGASICVQKGTTTEENLADYFATRKMKYTLVGQKNLDEMVSTYEAGGCTAITDDASSLASARTLLTQAYSHVILPEIISKEPLSSSVRKDDSQWGTIVRWVHFAMLTAEEDGVSSRNVEQSKASMNREVRRLLGVEGAFGESIGLSNDWAFNVIKQVGNYGEVFDRNVGAGSPLKLSRGLNNLWTKGGLQYAPPMR